MKTVRHSAKKSGYYAVGVKKFLQGESLQVPGEVMLNLAAVSKCCTVISVEV
jgi:hypothetical protein